MNELEAESKQSHKEHWGSVWGSCAAPPVILGGFS